MYIVPNKVKQSYQFVMNDVEKILTYDRQLDLGSLGDSLPMGNAVVDASVIGIDGL